MDDPKRLIHTASPDVQDLLRQGQESFAPPPGARDSVWGGVAEQVAAPPPSTHAPPSVIAKAGVQSKLVLWVGLAAMGGLVAARSLTMTQQPFEAPAPAQVVVQEGPTTLQTTEPRVRENERLMAPVVPAATPSTTLARSSSAHPQNAAALGTASIAPTASSETMQLATPEEEAAVVREARAAIRRGDASGALSILSGYERTYHGGVLIQERDFLRIEALRANHDPRAQAMIERFLRVYPDSPYRSRLVPAP